MKNSILAVVMLLSTTGVLLNAQDRPRQNREDQERFERFRSMKIAYYSERIEFTTEEAEQFWPVYNEFERQNSALSREISASLCLSSVRNRSSCSRPAATSEECPTAPLSAGVCS